MVRAGGWFDSEAGRQLARSAMAASAPQLCHLAGHNALVLQPCACPPPSLPFRSLIGLQRDDARFCGDFHAEDAALPLANDCLALVFAAFVLESSPSPEALLCEFERVLLADGHLVLLALNPLCPSRLGGGWRGLALRGAGRLVRMLQAAGFELLDRGSIGEKHRPAVLRSVNFLLARKRRMPLTPLRKHSHAVALNRKTTVP